MNHKNKTQGVATRRGNNSSISKKARQMTNDAMVEQGTDMTAPGNENKGIPKSHVIGAIHTLANKARISNDALFSAEIKKANGIEGMTKEAIEKQLELSQYVVDREIEAELVLESLERMNMALDVQYKRMMAIVSKFKHLNVERLSIDLEKMAVALENPAICKLLGVDSNEA